MTSNLELWNKVEKTNPAHTKALKFGRAITAIDAYHQIKNATEAFGPAGKGWGWEVKETKFLPTNEVAILVSLWHGQPVGSGERRVEQWGQNSMYGTGKKSESPDGDCMKKATTDGLTKCLSMIGFNADVFLGKFDDNKYVQQVTEEFTEKPEYMDFNKQEEWFKKQIAEGKTTSELIILLSNKYKVSQEVIDKIHNLRGE